jgi:hypothetical protein
MVVGQGNTVTIATEIYIVEATFLAQQPRTGTYMVGDEEASDAGMARGSRPGPFPEVQGGEVNVPRFTRSGQVDEEVTAGLPRDLQRCLVLAMVGVESAIAADPHIGTHSCQGFG